MAKKCVFKNIKTGEGCKAYAMIDSTFCFWHNPAISEEVKQEHRAAGGKKKQALPDRSLKTPADVASHLEEITNAVRSEKVDQRKAKLLNDLSGNLLKALEMSELEGRLSAMEAYIK